MNQPLDSAIDYRRAPIAMVVIALLGLPFAYIQAHSGILEGHPVFVMVFAVVALSLVGFLAYWFVFRHLPQNVRRSPYLIFFSIFAFATMLDLLIALSLLGYTDLMTAYFETGEPYLKSSYGMAVNLWDGTAHLALYVAMTYYLVRGESHRKTALFWSGSIMSACIVYMYANLIGEYAEHIEASYVLNVPFMIVPVFYAWKVIAEDDTSVAPARGPVSPMDWVLALALMTLATVCAFRMLAVLNPEVSLTQGWVTDVEPYLLNPSRYPQMQMLAYGQALMPFAVLATIAIWRRPSRGIAIWAWLFAGFAAQGQFGHIVGSLHAGALNPAQAVGEGRELMFWLANVLVAIVPLWFAVRYEQKLAGH